MRNDIKLLKAGQSGFGLMIETDSGYISPNDERNKQFVNEVKNMVSNTRTKVLDPLVLYVVLQKYGVKNRNGRIYPEHILIRENDNYQQLIKEKRAFGEAEHPESSIISTERISHNIIETHWEGKTLVGKLEIIMSPAFINQGIISCEGDRIANLLTQGYMLGVSSRGVGSLQEIDGNHIVQDDFELICWDVVTSPSTPGAWMFKNDKSAQPFVESTISNKSLLINKLNKFLMD